MLVRSSVLLVGLTKAGDHTSLFHYSPWLVLGREALQLSSTGTGAQSSSLQTGLSHMQAYGGRVSLAELLPLLRPFQPMTPVALAGQVPNIKGVQERSLVDIAHELARLQAAAYAGHLQQADLAGGTLTVSNIGAIGGTYAMPLVNVPEAAIVALGRCAHVQTHAPALCMHARSSL